MLSQPAGWLAPPLEGVRVHHRSACVVCAATFADRAAVLDHIRHRHRDDSAQPTSGPTVVVGVSAQYVYEDDAVCPSFPVPTPVSAVGSTGPSVQALLAHATKLEASRLTSPATFEPNDGRNPVVYDQILRYGDFLRDRDRATLCRLVAPAVAYQAHSKILAADRDPYRNVLTHVLDLLLDRSYDDRTDAFGVRKAIGLGDGNGARAQADFDGELQMVVSPTGVLDRVFEANLQPDTLTRYGKDAALLVLYALRVTPSVFRPSLPVPPASAGTPLPLPTLHPTFPETFLPDGSVDPSSQPFVTRCDDAYLETETQTVTAANALRAVLAADILDQPDGHCGKAGRVHPRPHVQRAVHGFLLVLIGVAWPSKPRPGQSVHEQFVILSSLREHGGYQDIRSFGPRLAGYEYLIRHTVWRGVLDQIGLGPVRPLTPAQVDQGVPTLSVHRLPVSYPLASRFPPDNPADCFRRSLCPASSLASPLLNLATAHPKLAIATAFSVLRHTRYPIAARLAKMPQVAALQTVPSNPSRPDEILPAVVYGKYISLSSVGNAVRVSYRNALALVETLSFGAPIVVIPADLTTIQLSDDHCPIGGSIFTSPANVRALGFAHGITDVLLRSFESSLWTSTASTSASPFPIPSVPAANAFLSQFARAKAELLASHHSSSPGARATEHGTQQATRSYNHHTSLIVMDGHLAIRTECGKTGPREVIRFVAPLLAPLFLTIFGPIQYLASYLLETLHALQPFPVESDHRASFRASLWTSQFGKTLSGHQIREIISRSIFNGGEASGASTQAIRQYEEYIVSKIVVPQLAHSNPTAALDVRTTNAQLAGHSVQTANNNYGNVEGSVDGWSQVFQGSGTHPIEVISAWQMAIDFPPVSLPLPSFAIRVQPHIHASRNIVSQIMVNPALKKRIDAALGRPAPEVRAFS